MIKIIILIVILSLIWAFGSWFFIRNIETQSYTVLESKNGYEIRKYDKHIIASTKVIGNQKDASNQGFKIIAKYIFGDNVSNESIAMTSPVTDQKGENISMTAPVIDEKNTKGEHVISFVMPSKYTISNLPKPNDQRIIIREVPEKTFAVLEFGWYPYEKRVNTKKETLREYLKRDGISFDHNKEPMLSRFNPPLTIPLLLKNEILIELEK